MALPLLELSPLVLLVIALGLAIIATVIVKALFGPLISALQAIPLIGGKLASPLEAIARALTGALGSVEGGIDKIIGASWHLLSKQWDWAWREIRRHGVGLAESATMLGTLIGAYHLLRRLVHGIHTTVDAHSGAVKTLEKEYHGIEHRVKVLEREIGKGIGHDLRTRVAGLEDELGKVEGKVIPSLRSLAGTAEADAQRALADFRSIPFPAGVKTWAEAIAAGITALGLGWLRCDANPFNNNRNACNLWGDLAGLLGLVTAILAVEDFDTLVHEMQSVEEVTIAAAKDFFGIV